jgi:hypothetical protein
MLTQKLRHTQLICGHEELQTRIAEDFTLKMAILGHRGVCLGASGCRKVQICPPEFGIAFALLNTVLLQDVACAGCTLSSSFQGHCAAAVLTVLALMTGLMVQLGVLYRLLLRCRSWI